jgi:hypothetical protein
MIRQKVRLFLLLTENTVHAAGLNGHRVFSLARQFYNSMPQTRIIFLNRVEKIRSKKWRRISATSVFTTTVLTT